MEFELPSVEPQAFHAKADVVWSDSFVMGLRFLYIEKHSGVALQTWLNSLEAQFHFREIGSTNLLTKLERGSFPATRCRVFTESAQHWLASARPPHHLD